VVTICEAPVYVTVASELADCQSPTSSCPHQRHQPISITRRYR